MLALCGFLIGCLLGVHPSNPSLQGEGAAGRCEAAGLKNPEAYSLEYVEDFFEPRTTQKRQIICRF
jgi:hypothetical protein